MNASHYRPEGFHAVTPYLIVPGAVELLDFMKAAFDAEVVEQMADTDGGIRHAQIRIGDSMLEVSSARPEWPASPASLHVYVPDVDTVYARALKAGAESLYEPDDKFYGDREAGVKDGSGNCWFLATRQEALSEGEKAG